MAGYLLIESRDPFQANDVERQYELAVSLRWAGHEVTLFLVDNGVLPARRGARSARLGELAQAGVEVLADEFSLRERGIPDTALAQGVKKAPIDAIVDRLEVGHKAVWH